MPSAKVQAQFDALTEEERQARIWTISVSISPNDWMKLQAAAEEHKTSLAALGHAALVHATEGFSDFATITTIEVLAQSSKRKPQRTGQESQRMAEGVSNIQTPPNHMGEAGRTHEASDLQIEDSRQDQPVPDAKAMIERLKSRQEQPGRSHSGT